MNIDGLGEIEAIGFDIDGTLYPQWRLTARAIFRYLSHGIFFLFYGLVRNEMHKLPQRDDFYHIQAVKMARKMKCSTTKASMLLDEIVYSGLEPYFKKVKCYPDVEETFQKFKEAGLKLALLSDFPPEQKGDIWGVKKYCDVILGTEKLGALKPDAYSFLKMAEKLCVPPEKILYVGNSKKYDVKGARNAGMKSAYLLPFWRKIFNISLKEADISFSTYRQLQKIVIQ